MFRRSRRQQELEPTGRLVRVLWWASIPWTIGSLRVRNGNVVAILRVATSQEVLTRSVRTTLRTSWRCAVDRTGRSAAQIRRLRRTQKAWQRFAAVVVAAAAAKDILETGKRLAAVIIRSAAARNRNDGRARLPAIVVRAAADAGTCFCADRPEVEPAMPLRWELGESRRDANEKRDDAENSP
jgi:hypothetical protein